MWVDPERQALGAGGSPTCNSYNLPPAPGSRTIPLPPASWGYLSDSYQGENDNFPDDGTNNHQFPFERTDLLAREATESSTSLAPAKPNNIENKNQSEVSSVYPARNYALR